MRNRSIRLIPAILAASLAALVGAGAVAANAQEPMTEQCLEPEICPIPYVRLSKQETEPFLFFGRVVDEKHPKANDYRKAIRRFPDVRSCLTTDEREKPRPDLRQIDWAAIDDIREIEVCIFRIASSIEDIETIKLWLQYHGFTVGRMWQHFGKDYVPSYKTAPISQLPSRLSIEEFRKIVPRTWFTRLFGLELGRSYALYMEFSQNGQLVSVTSSLASKFNT